MATPCNVLVVGAGPAGVSAAYFIKHYDKESLIKVDLVDRLDGESYIQYHKMCGEAVSKYLFDDIAPLKPQGIVEKIKLIREFWPNNIEIETKVEGYIIDRPQFLGSIIKEFKNKGGNFENKVVEGITQNDKKVKVKFKDELRDYDYVIAADGANSIIRNLIIGIKGEIKYCIQYIVNNEPERGVLTFYYDQKYMGDYKWSFPHGDKTKIGYPLIKGKIFKPEGKVLTKQSRAIGYGGIDRYVNGRILLIGDAACQTNALTKGGIRIGMLAGKLAAKAIINKNPLQYENEWLKTKFSSPIFMNAFRRLIDMDNNELSDHIKPFVDSGTLIAYAKCFLFYRRYLDLYRAYNLSEKAGW